MRSAQSTPLVQAGPLIAALESASYRLLPVSDMRTYSIAWQTGRFIRCLPTKLE